MCMHHTTPNTTRCEMCNVTISSPKQLDQHRRGKKYIRKAAKAGASSITTESDGSFTAETACANDGSLLALEVRLRVFIAHH